MPSQPAAQQLARPPLTVRVGGVEVGGPAFVVMAGPCAVESAQQIQRAAQAVSRSGAHVLRGGAFKPRTSPRSFQGLGPPGVHLLCAAAAAAGLPTVSEVMDESQLALMKDRVALLQVGARSMQNFSLLKALARAGRPVLLKRGLSATVEEWLAAADYLLDGGNPHVILCERGIRTFEPATRNTLDLGAVVLAKRRTGLPVIVDPSHACGVRELVTPLGLAAAACGADGLLVDVHPAPEDALCDGAQALTFEDFDRLMARLAPVLAAVGRALWNPGVRPVMEAS